MELDDDMILVIVGDEDSPDIIGPFKAVFKQEKDTISDEKVPSETLVDEGFPVSINGPFKAVFKQEKDTISDEKVPSETLVDEGFPVAIKEELDPIKEEPDFYQLECHEQLSEDSESFFNMSETTPTQKAKKPVRRRGRPKKSTKKGKNKHEDSENFDDFIPPLSLYKTVRRAKQNQKCNVADLAIKTKKKTVKKFFENSVSKPAKPTLKRKVAELTKKTQKKLDNLALSSNNNIPPLSESPNNRRRSKRNILRRKKELDDSAVSSDNNIPHLSKFRNDKRRSKPIRIKREIELDDIAVSYDKNIPPSSEFQSDLRMLNQNVKFHAADLDNQNTEEEKNELFDDSAVNSDSNSGRTQLLRRSLVSNPKSYVAELIKQRPELSDKTKALVDALVDVMRQVRPPPPPQDYYITNGVKFKCVECGRLSLTLPAASRHYQQRHGTRYLICFACGVDFRSTTELYKHEKRCIAPDATIVLRARARLLGAKGRSRPFLQPTRKSPTPKTAERVLYPCTLCSATFLSQAGLNAHTNFHLGRRPYVCDVCGLSYTSSCALTKHRRKHSSAQFICDYCGRDFPLRSALVQHMVMHQPQRKFLCAECPQRFAQRAALNMHVRRLHRGLPLPCACAVCHKRYPRMYELKQHMLREHGMTLMTRMMFYKQLPAMTDTQVMEAKVIVDENAENIVTENEMYEGNLSNTEEQSGDEMQEQELQPQDKQDEMDCDEQNTDEESVDKVCKYEINVVVE